MVPFKTLTYGPGFEPPTSGLQDSVLLLLEILSMKTLEGLLCIEKQQQLLTAVDFHLIPYMLFGVKEKLCRHFSDSSSHLEHYKCKLFLLKPTS